MSLYLPFFWSPKERVPVEKNTTHQHLVKHKKPSQFRRDMKNDSEKLTGQEFAADRLDLAERENLPVD